MAVVKGGHIEVTSNPKNYAGVDEAKATKKGANGEWTVTLMNVPTQTNFTVGQRLTYNSKGTRNPNADNYLIVKHVNGPTKYTCIGNWPINT